MIKLLLTASLFVFSLMAEDEPPTYKADPNQKPKPTGYVKKPLSFEQHRVKQELDELSDADELTFDYDVTQIGEHPTGLVKPKGLKGKKAQGINPLGAPVGHKEINLRDILGVKAPHILDQGNCGSCVVFSVTANAQWTMALRGYEGPEFSTGHLMNCGGSGGQCSGDWGERVMQRLKNLGSLFSIFDYPYRPVTASCKNIGDKPRYGQFLDWQTIPDKIKYIVEALNNRQAVSAGVAADGRFSSYKSGIYNGFGSMGTNHYVLIVGATCGSSVDKDGNCLFTEKGDLINGNHEATLLVANSWDENWGDHGYITMQFENKAGKRNNNIGGGDANMQIIETGIPWTPAEPVVFVVSNDTWTWKVTVQPTAKYSVEKAKAQLELAIQSAGKTVESAKPVVDHAISMLERGVK